ncbi:MAG: hypothetical protein M1820_003988 [Bogoriella megaspora]|nr:MAG: hypothetical protein M1820_003988 [Bogoriella megaspora]
MCCDSGPDIASWFTEDMRKSDYDAPTQQNLLSGNAISVIDGGSDTTGPRKYQDRADKVYDELETLEDSQYPAALASLAHSNGVINESMRLIPAALSIGTRVTPPEGIHFQNVFIPGGTKIAAPTWTIFRMPEAFEAPNEFVPEHWYNRPEMIRDKRAFQPFGMSRRICVGKDPAITQIRLVTAALLLKYRMRFAPGEDGEAVLRDMRDQVTAQAGIVKVVFESRTPLPVSA